MLMNAHARVYSKGVNGIAIKALPASSRSLKCQDKAGKRIVPKVEFSNGALRELITPMLSIQNKND